jgi:predicted alpha/beta hydrolase family esterase
MKSTKRAVILHAMEQNNQGHWYPWLKSELEKRGYAVWVPNLPHTDHPDTAEMTTFLLGNTDWDFTDNLVIGHSSGAVEVLYLLQALPPGKRVKTAVVASSFEKPVASMETQHDRMFTKPFDFPKIKQSVEMILFVHGDDDPWCPLDGARHLAAETGGELITVPGGKHLSTSLDPRFTEFPEVLELLEERHRL